MPAIHSRGQIMTTIRKREKENRRDRRQEINLVLHYKNNEFKVVDISLGGIAISGETTLFTELQDLDVVISNLKDDADESNVEISLITKRVNKEIHEVAFQFKALSEYQFSILERYLTGRKIVAGKSHPQFK